MPVQASAVRADAGAVADTADLVEAVGLVQANDGGAGVQAAFAEHGSGGSCPVDRERGASSQLAEVGGVQSEAEVVVEAVLADWSVSAWVADRVNTVSGTPASATIGSPWTPAK